MWGGTPIRSDSDNFITQYVHVTPLPGLSLRTHVTAGQQIGTVDLSGSSCSPHVHMARYTPSGSPTCDWQLKKFHFAPHGTSGGVTGTSPIPASEGYHPSVSPVHRSSIY
ncbi:peptidoglycan DD-metalloendopeptidase family protein [Bacillus toyonensis]|uniref:peptidoglycan DD-metalloendopeptidase family protein n=1 Tax=Bacillus toyonensis TaxID=155322 RepID=UPI0011455A6E|nr:peptidoglycan DD-metalloendopeptidase family protein [Bacillus toyonensis]